jgi:hypothetical protein
MNLTNLKAGKAFANVEIIRNRLLKFIPPAGEHYVMRRVEGTFFAVVGVSYGDEMYQLFRIYAAERDLYLTLRDMVCEAAESLQSHCEADEWPVDENTGPTRDTTPSS